MRLSVRTGIDLVANSRIAQKASNMAFLEKIFHPSEFRNRNSRKLSGIFALKESIFKALNIPASNWLEIEVRKSKSGRPSITLSDKIKPGNLLSMDCSISHEGDFTIGVVIMILSEDKK